MPLSPTNLSQDLHSKLGDFVRNYDFIELYRKYSWGKDTWQNGFPNILQLEIKITKAAKNNLLKKEDVLSVAKWGNLRNRQGVECSETVTLPLFENEDPDKKIEEDPSSLIGILQGKIKGLGPTYLSKVLRFALPSEFGAIDTRIVRVVGMGDPKSKQQSWLSLRVRNYGYGWYIPKNQSAWPKEYSKWINILRFCAHFLNNSGTPCPHPESFLKNDLRRRGIWACADVEMALFSYTSEYLNSKEGDFILTERI